MKFPANSLIEDIDLFIAQAFTGYDRFDFQEVYNDFFGMLYEQRTPAEKSAHSTKLKEALVKLQLIEANVVSDGSIGQRVDGEKLTQRAYDMYFAGGWYGLRKKEQEDGIFKSKATEREQELRQSIIDANNKAEATLEISKNALEVSKEAHNASKFIGIITLVILSFQTIDGCNKPDYTHSIQQTRESLSKELRHLHEGVSKLKSDSTQHLLNVEVSLSDSLIMAPLKNHKGVVIIK